MNNQTSLDDLYKMTAYIYSDANLSRSKEATFLHFVEVCGMLTQHARKKKRDNLNFTDALCKALGWYFPLVAKLGVSSVQNMVYRKYPLVCPYCRQKPHDDSNCKLVIGADQSVDHVKVQRNFDKNQNLMPSSLNQWQEMFQEIYPRTLNSGSFSVIALFEELGEIAEAIRVYDRHPHYFYGEAADIFSYLMGLANEHEISLKGEGENFDLEAEFLSRYPGLCINCGSKVCTCPPVPSATIGRMAKEIKLEGENHQIESPSIFAMEGADVAQSVFERVAVSSEIARHLPYDRGDLNSTLVQLCFRLANAIESIEPDLAVSLRQQAMEIGKIRAERGTASIDNGPMDILQTLKSAWSYLDVEAQQAIRESGQQVSDIAHIFDKQVLIITSNARGEEGLAIRLDREIRAIKEAFKLSNEEHTVRVENLTASTIDDLRRELMLKQYHFVHFAGHANDKGLTFEHEGEEETLEYEAFASMLSRQSELQAVVMNACESLTTIEDTFAPIVVGMMDEIEDEAAIAFAKGFYDAIAANFDTSRAFEEGLLSVKSKSHSTDLIAKMTSPVKT